MKRISFAVGFLLLFSSITFCQYGQWTWKGGDSVTGKLGVYFQQGIFSANNTPGARGYSCRWADSSGDMWLFGGSGYDISTTSGYLNDLWKYNKTTNQWAWIKGSFQINKFPNYGTKGIASNLSNPGARQSAVSWTDKSGNLWLFGGFGYTSKQIGYLNDIWKFDISLNEWAWIGGDTVIGVKGKYGSIGIASSNNFPGSREKAASWIDKGGNLWLFGGNGYASTGVGKLNDVWKYDISQNIWTWVNGDTVINGKAVYGTKGIAQPSNKIGSREGSCSWSDTSGNVWIFGGEGYTSSLACKLNDLWKYNSTTNVWTWLSGDNLAGIYGTYGTQGISSINNNPGSRGGSTSWIDLFGALWMFGGEGFGTSNQGFLNDLWKYDTNNNTWTWYKGSGLTYQIATVGSQSTFSPSNTPGGKLYSVGWFDTSGYLLLFGSNFNSNEMWKYDIGGNQWAWINGSLTPKASGVYGSPGTSSPFNGPGSREKSTTWTDTAGNFWLFGGLGNGISDIAPGLLNDLWKYDVNTQLWIWMHGTYKTNSLGIYGIQGIASSANMPGSRELAASWVDDAGNLWLFGGLGHGTYTGRAELNDLWKYNIATNQWTWVKGDSVVQTPGVYGTKGVSSVSNKPGGRTSSFYWKDVQGNLWIFGGSGNATSGDTVGILNDLWKYSPTTNEWTWINGDNFFNYSGGVYGVQGAPSVLNKPGGRYSGVNWADSSGNLWLFGGNGRGASGSFGFMNDLWKYNILSNNWTWMKGDAIPYQPGVYGIQGISSPTNKPTNR